MENVDNHDRYLDNITVMSPAGQWGNHDRLFSPKATGNESTALSWRGTAPCLEEDDRNCFCNDLGFIVARVLEREAGARREITLKEWQAMGFGRHSVFGDLLFVDPERWTTGSNRRARLSRWTLKTSRWGPGG